MQWQKRCSSPAAGCIVYTYRGNKPGLTCALAIVGHGFNWLMIEPVSAGDDAVEAQRFVFLIDALKGTTRRNLGGSPLGVP